MKTYSIPTKTKRRGFVNIITVVVVTIFCVALMTSAFRSTVRSLDAQRKVQLQLDYEAREQAFLRALVSLAPVHAANTMVDGSQGAPVDNSNTSFQSLYTAAGELSNFSQAIDPDTIDSLMLNDIRSLNVADSNYTSALEYVGASADSYATPGAVNADADGNYPPPLYARGSVGSSLTARDAVDFNAAAYAQDNLLLSSSLAYGTSNTPHEGIFANDDVYDQHNVITYPNIHFGYGEPGGPIVGKHNWWRVFLHPEIRHMNATGLTREITGGYYLDREYVLSIYELPAQLPINAATAITLGQVGTEAWQNVTIGGGIAAERVTTLNSVVADRLATRRGATLSADTTLGTNGETYRGDSVVDRETFEATAQGFFPISKASDTARAMFIAINPGNEFFDRFATINDFDESPIAGRGNRLSTESWYQYSMGCHRCAMKLDVVAVRGAADQTPTEILFTYKSAGEDISLRFSKADGSWPDPDPDQSLETFPFHVISTVPGRPSIELNIARLWPWMQTLTAAPDPTTVNNSIVINADYTQAGNNVAIPRIPTESGDISLLLADADDFTVFSTGFSIVTNFRTYLMSDVNTVTTTPPASSGLTGEFRPPFSLFCPEMRVGLDANNTRFAITGQVGSFGESTDAGINVLDFKLGTTEQVRASKVRANLTQITHPAQLPPINLMNWLIVVQRVMDSEHADY
ncbi:hypothetical protein Rhal01_03653 [Rubritalea halochordaticola]|uniref:Uncharacterized protein n=1 Tax=Rubritalea halochordaticola TaxID=714537 RepID=A0ABP9V468_9BACT